MDLLIKNGFLADGSGRAMSKADIGVADGRIIAIETEIPGQGAQDVIDATGCVVCPGFIDAHSHDDIYLMVFPECREKVLQGVTTTIGGNCGISPSPMTPEFQNEHADYTRILGMEHVTGGRSCFQTFAGYLDAMEAARPGIHYAALVGHGTLRLAAMGMSDQKPGDAQMAAMKRLLKEALDAGALGMSSGLIYAPGSYADTDELTELSRLLAVEGGLYTTHMRNEGTRILESVRESIRIGEQSGAPVHISHHKIANRSAWGQAGQALQLMAEAEQRGLRVTGDQYPYSASCTTLATTLPDHFLAAGMETLRKRLHDPAVREQIRRDIQNDPIDHWRSLVLSSGDYGVTISFSKAHPEYVGRFVADIAAEQHISPYDVVMDLVLEEANATIMTIHNQCEADIEQIMQSPRIMAGSDGLPGFGGPIAHPRMTGTFPRILGRYVRERSVISLEEAIRKMTSLPAQTFGLSNKGLVKVGYDADLAVFDPDRIVDGSDYLHPGEPPTGMKYVLVNGVTAVKDGDVTGKSRGRVLRRK